MTSATTPRNAIAQMLAEVDPRGDLARGMAEIEQLVADDAVVAARTFFSTYMDSSGLRNRLQPTTLAKIETAAHEYVRQKLRHYSCLLYTSPSPRDS